MFYALGWFAVVLLLALWSLAVWSIHALGAWAVSSAGTVAEAAARDAASRLPDWLAPWMPAELAQALESMASSLASLFAEVPDLGSVTNQGLTLAAWVLWGLGSLVLLGGGLLAHGLHSRWKGRAALPVRRPASPMPG